MTLRARVWPGSALAMALSFAPALATAGRPALVASASVGTLRFDRSLANYRWETSARMTPALSCAVAFGRWELGARVVTARTEQSLGFAATPARADVHWTSGEIFAGLTAVRWRSLEFRPSLAVGRVALRYEPDRAAVETPSGPIAVRLAPIDEWVCAAALEGRAAVTRTFGLGLSLERTLFRLDTVHQEDGAAVTERSTFGAWSLRLGLSTRFPLAR